MNIVGKIFLAQSFMHRQIHGDFRLFLVQIYRTRLKFLFLTWKFEIIKNDEMAAVHLIIYATGITLKCQSRHFATSMSKVFLNLQKKNRKVKIFNIAEHRCFKFTQKVKIHFCQKTWKLKSFLMSYLQLWKLFLQAVQLHQQKTFFEMRVSLW